MRAALMHAVNPSLDRRLVEIEEVPTPEPRDPHDVVVRIAAAGVCRTELHLLAGELPIPLPLIPGHENAGHVAAVGTAVTAVEPGDPVACYPFLRPGLSPADRLARKVPVPEGATPGIDTAGGYAEYMVATESAMVRLPEGTDPTPFATLTDAGLAAYRGYKKALPSIGPGDTVLVQGVGGLGHLAVQLLRDGTDATIVAVDPRAEARDLAAECGAHLVLSPEDDLEAAGVADVAASLDFAGSDATAANGLAALRFGGIHVAVGVGGSLTTPILDVVGGEKRIEGVYVGTYDELVELTELLLKGRISPRIVRYPLEEADAALHDLAAGAYVGRAVLVP